MIVLKVFVNAKVKQTIIPDKYFFSIL